MLSLMANHASAEPFTTIRDNGDPANRVDIAILGDGYTAAQLAQYAADVAAFVKGLFAQQPFREYQRYFNVHRVDVISSDSGADHPERSPQIFRNTALGAAYNCAGIQRLICVELDLVNNVLTRSISPERRDVIIVIVNDPEYGGSGGAVAVTSVNSQVIELVLHELGHSFGLLADEYDTDPDLCNDSVEPSEPNVTREMNRNSIKWNVGGSPPSGWIDLATPIPTMNSSPGFVGLYEGARYCTTGLFRPTFNSKMRSLERPFEQVNSEQLVRRIYNLVSPIDASAPLASAITLPPNGTQEFRVETPSPLTGQLEITWKVDGQIAGHGSQLVLNASALESGSHSVEAVVQDPTAFVRDDPANLLVERRTWNVTIDVAPIQPNTVISSAPAALSKTASAVFVFASTIPGSKFTCSLDGAAFTPCRSPKKLPRLVSGFHTFQVTSTDLQGVSDTSPATHTWTIDTTLPETTITAGPPVMSRLTNATFQFASGEGNSTFRCKLDAGAYTPCTSPQTYNGMLPGRHAFSVAAIDQAGNIDRRPALHRWIIDTAAPETTIRIKPPAVTNNKTATFSFAASQRGSTFECSLNAGAFQLCSSRQIFPVTPGAHTLQVRATDPAGNTDLLPASYSWTVLQ
jgi:hypothetical protein